MKINIETKFNAGKEVYLLEKEFLTGTGYDACIRKIKVKAILIDNEKYLYVSREGNIEEERLFGTLKEAKEKALELGYKRIHLCMYS